MVGLEKIYFERQITAIFRSLLILLDGIPSPGQLLMPVLALVVNLSFLLVLKLNQSNKQSFSKGKNLPQLWDGFIYTPGYGNLKSPLCWKQLNHTKDNQSNNTRKLGYVPYRQCQYVISLEDKDLYRID